jgi:hypothetical protein
MASRAIRRTILNARPPLPHENRRPENRRNDRDRPGHTGAIEAAPATANPGVSGSATGRSWIGGSTIWTSRAPAGTPRTFTRLFPSWPNSRSMRYSRNMRITSAWTGIGIRRLAEFGFKTGAVSGIRVSFHGCIAPKFITGQLTPCRGPWRARTMAQPCCSWPRRCTGPPFPHRADHPVIGIAGAGSGTIPGTDSDDAPAAPHPPPP